MLINRPPIPADQSSSADHLLLGQTFSIGFPQARVIYLRACTCKLASHFRRGFFLPLYYSSSILLCNFRAASKEREWVSTTKFHDFKDKTQSCQSTIKNHCQGRDFNSLAPPTTATTLHYVSTKPLTLLSGSLLASLLFHILYDTVLQCDFPKKKTEIFMVNQIP